MFPTFGVPDTLAEFGGLNHGSGLIQLAANPYAAMPSLHAADALIVGLSMFLVCRRWWSKTIWLLWPAWVWFSVMATGNHFWLDILAGIVVAAIAGVVIYRKPLWRRLRPAAAPAPA
jgi:membrane-associated phospholipid phosphatase